MGLRGRLLAGIGVIAVLELVPVALLLAGVAGPRVLAAHLIGSAVILAGGFAWYLVRQKKTLAALAEATARNEQLLRESEEQFRALVELSPDAVLIGIEGGAVYANLAAARLLGLDSPVQLLGRPLSSLVEPSRREAMAAQLRDTAEAGAPAPFTERLYVRADGTPIEVEDAVIPHTYRGQPAVQLVARELTSRKRAEAARDLLSRVIEGSSEGILLFTEDGRIGYANAAAARLCGMPRDGLVGHDLAVVAALGGVSSLDLIRVAFSDRGWEGPFTFRRQDGAVTEARVSLRRVLEVAGRQRVAVVAARDVTHERRIEEQLFRARTTGATGRLGPEFGDLLTVILGSARVIERRLDAENPNLADVREIARAAGGALALARQAQEPVGVEEPEPQAPPRHDA